MSTYTRKHFVEMIDAGKARAEARRARGLSGGNAAKGWTRTRQHHTPAAGTWERTLGEVRAHWHHAKGAAAEDYARAVYPERYEGLWPWR